MIVKSFILNIEKFLLNRKLNGLLDSSEIITIDDTSRIILFSDCHRGEGGSADDFAHNQLIFIAAMKHYLKNDYTYIELGDGDELWENKSFKRIKLNYRTIYELFREFHQKKKFYFVWGNHNRKWKNVKKTKNEFSTIISGETHEIETLLENFRTHEGLILCYKKKDKKILAVHGHQGELLNDTFWWFGRFIIRNFWKIMQGVFGWPDPTRPAHNYGKQLSADMKISTWIEKTGIPVIIGHTHQSVFPLEGDTPYFNTGSCVHPRCITGIEINKGKIHLVKWFVDVSGKDNMLSISKKELAKPKSLAELF